MLKSLFAYWDWSDTWGALLFSVVVGLVVFAGVAAFADHRVRAYYLGAGSDGCACIYSEVNFDSDYRVLCSHDRSMLLQDLERLNATLVKR